MYIHVYKIRIASWPAVHVCEGSLQVARLSAILLTLGAHAPEGYSTWSVCLSVCLCVCVCVCVCVCFPYSGTSRNQAYKQQYQRLQRDTGMKYKKGFFFKTLRSEVMASFTHLE